MMPGTTTYDLLTQPHHAHPSFETHTFDSAEPVSVQRLHAVFGRLPPTVLRVRGIAHLAEETDNSCVLQSTGNRAALTAVRPRGDRNPLTQNVFIGAKGGVDGDRLDALRVNAPWDHRAEREQTRS